MPKKATRSHLEERRTHLYLIGTESGHFDDFDKAVKVADSLKNFLVRESKEKDYHCIGVIGVSRYCSKVGEVKANKFGKREFELNMTPSATGEVVRHMLDEHCILLAGNGYNVSTCWNCDNAKILIDEKFFGRVIDNVFSNIGKYADRERAVNITVSADEKVFKIITKNYISDDTSSAESNGIGNKTCAKIMEQLSGDFKSYPDGELYINEISLPLYREESSKPNKK